MGREQDILNTAAAAFYEKGFHGVSVDELGKRAGLSGPALYRSFSGKDEILATLLNEAMDELMSATIPVHDDAAQDLERAILHHVNFALREGPLVSIYQREVRSLVDPWKKSFYHRRRRYNERWTTLIRRRYPNIDLTMASVATQSLLGLVFSIPHWPAALRSSGHVQDLALTLLSKGYLALDEVEVPPNQEI